MPFAKWILEKRKELGLTQGQLAERVGVSVSYISALERNEPFGKYGRERKPSVEIVDKIAKALQLDRDETRIKAGYAPEQPLIIKKPQTLDELIEALEHLGIENLHFHEHDRLRTATPRQLQEVLDAVKLAVQLIIARQENEGHNPGNSLSHDEENPIRPDR
jgi:transcriptional regulator with XRE-family HTH domain